MRPAALEHQLTRLLAEGYEAVTFSEAVRRAGTGKTMAVTFDDAFASVAELAKPIMDRLGVPGSVYAVSKFAEGGLPLEWDGIERWKDGPHAHELRSLDWARLRALADEGWEVGSHTIDHPHLTRCDDDELDRQLAGSRAALERGMQRPCASIAYPYGDLDLRVMDAAARAGYQTGAALPPHWHRPRPLAWPRVGIYHRDERRRFTLKTARVVRMLRTQVQPGLPRFKG